MKKILLLLICFGLSNILFSQVDYTKFVDPMIGTGGHAHTFPGATLPFGMVQLSPDTDNSGWDWCSGYHYSDNSIMGFSHTHLSGTGCADLGDILFMPFTGEDKLIPGSKENPDDGYGSRFSHSDEITAPGFYSVLLKDYNIDVELTATKRTGLHKYKFNTLDENKIIIDLEHGISDKSIETKINIINKKTISGFRRSKGWANDHTIYFYAEFSKKFSDKKIFENNKLINDDSFTGKKTKCVLSFGSGQKEIIVKVGISHTSIEGAKANLEKENPDWDFKKIKSLASEEWNNKLSKIEISSNDVEQKQIFYTAYYHCLIAPNLYSNVDGSFRSMDRKILKSETDQYTVFSLWDTYRALHPLLFITEPKISSDFVNSILTKYKNSGLLPVWELAGNETNCMIGYHAVPVLLDAYVKGIKYVNLDEILKAALKSGEQDIRSTDVYRTYGIIPSEVDNEGVSKTLEYAYDDWCISEIARLNNQEKIAADYFSRSKNYINYFDKSVNFMRPKRNGKWVNEFSPHTVTTDFTEANSWQYTFSVQHDIPGLINLFKSKEDFSKKLDLLFTANPELDGRHQPDITGLIGQYAQGNEPSHHVAYLYNYVGDSWKTQKTVSMICDSLYQSGPEGLSGNDDCGQMSAWYVFSSMGFYPVTPGSDKYLIGTPKFDRVKINQDNGKAFIIKANKKNNRSVFIKNAELNDRKYNKPFLTHQNILAGDRLVFNMSDKPNKDWGKNYSEFFNVDNIKKLPQPILKGGQVLFAEKTKITLDPLVAGAEIFYTLNDETPNRGSQKYNNSLIINNPSILKFRSYKEGHLNSTVNIVKFNKIKSDFNLISCSKPHKSYPGDGEKTLVDGIRGGKNFRTGTWQGFEGEDFEAVIDLGKIKTISKVGAGVYQDQGSWIFMPEKIEVFISKDNKGYAKIAEVVNKVKLDKQGSIIQDLVKKIDPVETRFVKIKISSIKKCPEWHGGAGLDCFIFIDEIIIE